MCKLNYAAIPRPVKRFVPQLVGITGEIVLIRTCYREDAALVYRQNLLYTCGKIPLTHTRPG
jgi:hypothetical protein